MSKRRQIWLIEGNPDGESYWVPVWITKGRGWWQTASGARNAMRAYKLHFWKFRVSRYAAATAQSQKFEERKTE